MRPSLGGKLGRGQLVNAGRAGLTAVKLLFQQEQLPNRKGNNNSKQYKSDWSGLDEGQIDGRHSREQHETQNAVPRPAHLPAHEKAPPE
jgi:hypothetical protein